MSDDHSPGDARKPYSDQGGTEGRHAQTHDVRREHLSNPMGPVPEDTSFADQMASERTGGPGGHQQESIAGVDDKVLHAGFPELSNDELARLSVLEPGTPLEQGGIYVDLNNLADGPFKPWPDTRRHGMTGSSPSAIRTTSSGTGSSARMPSRSWNAQPSRES